MYMNFQGPTFHLDIPTDWTITSSPQFQAVFLAPGSGDGLRPNMTISMRPVQEGVTPAAVAEEAAQLQRQRHADFTVLEESSAEEKSPSFFRRFRWTNTEQQVSVLQAQVYIVYGGLLYIITTTSTGDAAIEESFAHMLNTFRLDAAAA
jgi:hypothetical protein